MGIKSAMTMIILGVTACLLHACGSTPQPIQAGPVLLLGQCATIFCNRPDEEEGRVLETIVEASTELAEQWLDRLYIGQGNLEMKSTNGFWFAAEVDEIGPNLVWVQYTTGPSVGQGKPLNLQEDVDKKLRLDINGTAGEVGTHALHRGQENLKMMSSDGNWYAAKIRDLGGHLVRFTYTAGPSSGRFKTLDLQQEAKRDMLRLKDVTNDK